MMETKVETFKTFNPGIQNWRFVACMSTYQCQCRSSIRLGTVAARTERQAIAKVEAFFFGGLFYPNQIYVWPSNEELIVP